MILASIAAKVMQALRPRQAPTVEVRDADADIGYLTPLLDRVEAAKRKDPSLKTISVSKKDFPDAYNVCVALNLVSLMEVKLIWTDHD